MSKLKPRVKLQGDNGKITIKFRQSDYEKINNLAFALDISPTTTCAVLLILTLRSKLFMIDFLNTYHTHISNSTKTNVYNLLRI